MPDFVPEDIAHLITTLEALRDEAHLEHRRVEKTADEAELREACATINDWLERFEQTVGPAAWRLTGEGIVLYASGFWNGKPVPQGETVYGAQLRFESPSQSKGRLAYEELEHGRVSARYWQTSALHLWRSLHPDFVLQCAAHLSGPQAWTHVREALHRHIRVAR